MSENVTLYRPVGAEELKLIAASGATAFPPRLPEQPIFYPVTNEGYAAQIARDWNTKHGSKQGFVTRFDVDAAYAAGFDRKVVGGKEHEELWVPAEDLEEFNRHIRGKIVVISHFTPDGGERHNKNGLELATLVGSFNPVVRLADLDLEYSELGTLYASQDRHFTTDMGLTKLGATYTVVPPGKRSCPYHVHHAKDEMFVILAGEGEYRFGDKRYPVKAGDVLGAPVGGPEYAHQILNTSDKPLAYIGISSTSEFEVVEYPDSGKFQVIERKSTTGDARFRHVGRAAQNLDYWDGEDVGGIS